MAIRIYTDGAATMKKINGEYIRENGGWSFAYEIEGTDKIKVYYGGKALTTNNEMELTAIAEALSLLKSCKENIIICSDSAYCINIYTQWAKIWENNGWTRRGGKHKPIENLEIIKKTWNLMKEIPVNITFEKVKGHSGNKMNDIVDSFAVKGKNLENFNKTIWEVIV